MKHQNSYSFFCCFCEDSKRRDKRKNNLINNQLEKSSQISNIYKIDTNSNITEKVVVPPLVNMNKTEMIKQNKENYVLENIKTIDSYRSMNNKNKNQYNQKKENINNLKNFHRNFLQNDINSFLEKKEKNDINVENLSFAFKKYEKNACINNINNNIIQKENEKVEESKNNEIIQDVKNIAKIPLPNNNVGKDEIKTFIENTNKINSNQSLIKMNEKENTISQTIKRINKFEFDDNNSNEQLLWNNKTKNSNQNSNLINKSNIIEGNSNNNITNNQIQNEIKNEKDNNQINNVNIDNDMTCEKEEKEDLDLAPKNKDKEKDALFNKMQKDNKTIQQKENNKIAINNSKDINSCNSAFELKNHINNIPINLIKDEKIIKNEDDKNKKEKSLIKEENKEINKIESHPEIKNKTDINESQSLSQNGISNSINNIKEGINIKLNYLTEFYTPNSKQEEKEKEELKTKSIKESVSEEIEDEVGSIDEFNDSNDNRSVLSSYIFSSVRPTESNKSYTCSLYGHSESQDLISNYNELMSNKGMRIYPVEMNNNKEIEIRMDSLQRNRQNYFISMQMNQMKKMKEKIEDKEKTIQNNYSMIERLKNKMEKMSEEGKQYERWIEKEQEENENLTYLLNFLIECK